MPRILFLYELLAIVAAVPITPILPFFVHSAAILDAGVTTSTYGTSNPSAAEEATELTVPQAATISFTLFDFKKFISCLA